VKKPEWWTGSWAFKSVLIWFAGFLIWLPIFSRWPNSTASTVATLVFGLSLLPLALLYGIGVLVSWFELVLSTYTAVTGSSGGIHFFKRLTAKLLGLRARIFPVDS